MSINNFSNILLNRAPKKINNITENTLDILSKINEALLEINSIDFCNPFGYILTKALPPDGIIDNIFKKYTKKINTFCNKITNKIELGNTINIIDDIEEIRLDLEELIIPEELKDVIPGADSLMKLIQEINDSLVITNIALSLKDRKRLLKSFSNKLLPFTNPINITELLLKNQVENLNKDLNKLIKPERFKESIISLIKLLIIIDKSIVSINNTMIIINKIIKTINILIKIYRVSSKVIKLLPAPAQFLTAGSIITSSSQVSKIDKNIEELEKLLINISLFLNNSVIKQINRIRKEIIRILVGLEQLNQNISSCSYFNDDIIKGEILKTINLLQNNLNNIDLIFPSIIDNQNNNKALYKGYNIVILKEKTTDNNTSLIRRRVIVTNNQNIIEYEGDQTYSNKDDILIKEGQYFIDLKHSISSNDKEEDNISEEQLNDISDSIGIDNINTALYKESKIKELLKNKYKDENDFNNIIENDIERKQKLEKIIKSIINQYSKTPNVLQNRINILNNNLQKRGYKQEDILNILFNNKSNNIIFYINNGIIYTK